MHETNANVIACKIASWKSSMRISKNRNKTIVIHDYSSIILATNFRLRETENFVALAGIAGSVSESLEGRKSQYVTWQIPRRQAVNSCAFAWVDGWVHGWVAC